MPIPRILLALASLAAAALAAACMSYSPSGIPPGASTTQVTQAMGPSTASYPAPGGGERLEFRRGPQGLHTYMLDFDAQGRLLKSEQVLTEARFNALQPGISREQVLRELGHPSDIGYICYQKRVLWSYRFDSPFCLWFQVSLDEQGNVVDTGYNNDPRCPMGGRERE